MPQNYRIPYISTPGGYTPGSSWRGKISSPKDRPLAEVDVTAEPGGGFSLLLRNPDTTSLTATNLDFCPSPQQVLNLFLRGRF